MSAHDNPMSDAAAEAALRFLGEQAEAAGVARAQMVTIEHWRKAELARLRRIAPCKTIAERDDWARDHPEYHAVIAALEQAIKNHEMLAWKKGQAEATLDAWRTKNANLRVADKFR